MDLFLQGLHLLLNWQHFLIIPVGLALGIVVGAIPGLTSDLGIILCIPLTYGMEPTTAILMLLAIYCGGTYCGSITAILINTPGHLGERRDAVRRLSDGTQRSGI